MRRRALAPILVALGCVLATTVVWLLAFQSASGARLDASVLRGFTGLRGSDPIEALAAGAARLADPLPFAVMALALVALALARHRPRDAIVVGAILMGANITTQLLKQLADAPRPADAPPIAPLDLAWPSGHTTAAMSLALCLVLVVPARSRPLAAAVGGVFAVAQGYGLLVMGWHYPSDVLAAFGVAAAWAALGVAVLRITTSPSEETRLRLRTVFGPAVVAALAGAALAAGAALLSPGRAFDYAQEHMTFVLATVVLGAAGLALAAATAAALPSIEDGATAGVMPDPLPAARGGPPRGRS